ncbi:MAG: helix-turn-helix domain-containing protein [Candidatus Babeliales bacterium]
MERKSFQKYLEKRFTKPEIKDIERQAELEKRAMQNLQQDIANLMSDYMEKEKIGFNELVRRLDVSPAHVAKIQKGQANLTLSSLARIAALLDLAPHLVFTEKK